MNSIIESLSSTLLSAAILNTFIRLTVVSFIGWVVVELLRNRPATARHTASRYALFTLLLIPLFSPLAKYSDTRIVTLDVFREASGVATVQGASEMAAKADAAPASPESKQVAMERPQTEVSAVDMMMPPDIPAGPDRFLDRNNLFLAVNTFGLIWATGTAVLLLHLLYGLVFLRGFRSGLRKLDSCKITSLLGEIEKTFPRRGHVSVYLSPVIHSPVAVGIIHPIVILPESLYETATEAELKSIFLHELAHIRRLDHILGLFQRIVLALNWWNPLVHHINKACSITKEEISDNYAIQGIGSARLYSECLINLADKVCLISNLPATAGMAGKYISLEKRIKNIIAKERNMKTQTGTLTKVVGGVLMLATAICLAGSGVDVNSTNEHENRDQDANDNPESVIRNMAHTDDYTLVSPHQYHAEIREKLGRNREESVEVAIRLLNDPDFKVRVAATTALVICYMNDKSIAERLIQLLDNQTSNRETVALALASLGDERAIEPFIQLLDRENDIVLRNLAITGLSRFQDERAADALLKLLEDELPAIQAAACTALARMGDKRAAPAAVKLLDAESATTRQIACHALQMLGDKRAVPYAVQALSSNDDRARLAAAKIVASFHDERALEPLIALLDSKEKDIRLASVMALGDLQDKRAVKHLKERQETETLPVIQRAITRTLNALESGE